MWTDYDVIIIGGGPAGLSAAIYTSRAGLRTLLLEKGGIGGELMNRELIENYPGFGEEEAYPASSPPATFAVIPRCKSQRPSGMVSMRPCRSDAISRRFNPMKKK